MEEGKSKESHLPPHFHPTTAIIDQEYREKKNISDSFKIPMATVYLTSMFCSLWDVTVQLWGRVVSGHKLYKVSTLTSCDKMFRVDSSYWHEHFKWMYSIWWSTLMQHMSWGPQRDLSPDPPYCRHFYLYVSVHKSTISKANNRHFLLCINLSSVWISACWL